MLADGTEISAKVAGRDPGSDLAVLKLERAVAPVAEVTKTPARLGQIALVMNQLANTDIFVLKNGTKEPRRITFGSSIETSPSWSPDGRQLAFVSDHRAAAGACAISPAAKRAG
jgi:hypothetical protein